MSDRENTLRTWARSADLERRIEAADADDLPVELMRELLRDPDEQVVTAVLSNYETPREVLEEARILHPGNLDQLTQHPNAPLDLAEALPLWQHTYLSITSYCEARNVGDAVRKRVLLVWGDADPSLKITLAEAVEAAR